MSILGATRLNNRTPARPAPDEVQRRMDRAVKDAISDYIATNRVDPTSRDLSRLHATSVGTYACALFRADNVASVPMVVKYKGDAIEDDHPLRDLFKKAFNFTELMRRSEIATYYWGRNLLHKRRNTYGVVRDLDWVNPNVYSLDTASLRGLRGFYVYASNLYRVEPISYITLGDSVYMNEIDLQDDFEGVAPAEVAFLQASIAPEIAQTALSTFRNMAIPAGVVQPAEGTNGEAYTEERVGKLIAMLRRVAQGAINAGRTIVTPVRWEWITLQRGLGELAATDLDRNALQAVAIASRLPLELIIPSAANFAQFEGARRTWGHAWLKPRCLWYGGMFTEQVAREFGDDYSVEPDFEAVSFLKEDATTLVKVVREKVEGTLISLYDAQREIGDEPDERLRDLYMVPGVGPVPVSEIRNLWRYKLTIAPSVFNAGVIPGNPIPYTPQVTEQTVAAEEVSDQPAMLAPRPTRAFIPESAYRELKNWQLVAERKGKAHPFKAEALPAAVAAYVRLALDDDETIEAVFAEAKAYYGSTGTREHFKREVFRIINAANQDETSRRAFGGAMRAALRRYGLQAFIDGMNDGGLEVESLSTDDLDIFRAWQSESSDYVTNLGASLYQGGVVLDDAEVSRRAELWCNKSLDDVYFAGLRIGGPSKRATWRRDDLKDSCDTCKFRDGQTKTVDEWGREGFPRDRRLDCGGWECGCELYDMNGRRIGAR